MTKIERRLHEVNERIALGRKRVVRQMEIVRERELQSRPTAQSRRLLENLQDSLEFHEVHRNGMLKALSA